jgi:hypothetical protein
MGAFREYRRDRGRAGSHLEVQAILHLVVENLERLPSAGNATDAVHLANELLGGVYEQLQSLLEPEHTQQEVLAFHRRSDATVARQQPARISPLISVTSVLDNIITPYLGSR